MLKPAGTLSLAVGNLSGAAAIGGGATGASLAAASPAGRPISGDPGGSGAAAAPAAGDAAGCWAAAPSVKAVSKAPASTRLRGADEWHIIGRSPWRKPLSLRVAHEGADVRWLSGGQSQYFSVDAQPETWGRRNRVHRMRGAGTHRRASVLRHRAAGRIEDRLGERKLQHDLAVVVCHLDDRAQQRAVGAIGLEQLADHGARHFPGAVGIDEHFAVGIGNQLIADTGV